MFSIREATVLRIKKGNTMGMSQPTNAPGLYIAKGSEENDLVVVMNTFDKFQEEVIIPDFPSQQVDEYHY